MGAKREVGHDLYVISSNMGAQANRACVIKAHGVMKKKSMLGRTPEFDLGGKAEMRFYAPLGSNLTGNFCMLFDGKETTPERLEQLAVERCTGVVRDLEVTKSIDYHQSSYLSNSQASAWIDTMVREHADAAAEQGLTNYWFLENFCDKIALDIVTVRNRNLRMTPLTLSEVWAELVKAGYDYKVIHCYTCRTDTEREETHWNVHRKRYVEHCPSCRTALMEYKMPDKCPDCGVDLSALLAPAP